MPLLPRDISWALTMSIRWRHSVLLEAMRQERKSSATRVER